jgi:hypothetical protein
MDDPDFLCRSECRANRADRSSRVLSRKLAHVRQCRAFGHFADLEDALPVSPLTRAQHLDDLRRVQGLQLSKFTDGAFTHERGRETLGRVHGQVDRLSGRVGGRISSGAYAGSDL